MPAPAVYFMSDAHLGAASGAAPDPREALLHGFLGALPGREVSVRGTEDGWMVTSGGESAELDPAAAEHVFVALR